MRTHESLIAWQRARAFVLDVYRRSTIEIATREGHPPRSSALEFARTMLTDPARSLTTSMLRDLKSGAAVERDRIVGWMLEKARVRTR